MTQPHILICRGTACISSESKEVQNELEKQIQQRNLNVPVTHTGCFGFCALGPIMIIEPEGTMYCEVRVEDVGEIIERHIMNGQVVERLLYKNPKDNQTRSKMEDIDFFNLLNPIEMLKSLSGLKGLYF